MKTLTRLLMAGAIVCGSAVTSAAEPAAIAPSDPALARAEATFQYLFRARVPNGWLVKFVVLGEVPRTTLNFVHDPSYTWDSWE